MNSFVAGESEVAQGIFEESGGVAARYAEAAGKVVFRAVRAFPVQVVIRLAVLVRQSTVRFRRNMPAGFVIRVGASERSVVRERNRDVRFFFRIKIITGFNVSCSSSRSRSRSRHAESPHTKLIARAAAKICFAKCFFIQCSSSN